MCMGPLNQRLCMRVREWNRDTWEERAVPGTTIMLLIPAFQVYALTLGEILCGIEGIIRRQKGNGVGPSWS